jgi:4-diphosphocytidyl-2C-methyl-D-erythritol kinase
LQPAAFDLQPLVRKVYDRLTNCRPLGVLLSGSGASVFAVGRSAADAAAVADRFVRLTGPDPELAACRVFVARTLGEEFQVPSSKFQVPTAGGSGTRT